ncbi:MAG: efflux RND transporter periplasmic adaptor subunit [Rhizobiaceae bacterium]
MDQIVRRTRPGDATEIEAALQLDSSGRPKRRRRVWRWLILVLILVAAAGIYEWQVAGREAQPVAFQTVAAETGDLTVEVSATGTLQPLTQVDISSELSGVVRSVLVDANERVARGQVLAELDTTRLAAQVERGEASVQAAAAKVTDSDTTLKEAEQTFQRASQLAQRGMTTEQALETATAARDRAASAVEAARANLAIAQADLKLQQADLAKTKIYSPIDGIVLTRAVNPGQTVASSMQAPVLFVIAAELEKMELKAAIDEADIGGVTAGQKARFTVDAFPERKFDAAIRDIAYAAVTTEGVVTYDARLDVDNAELLLRPGMTATVSVITREAKDIVTVPSAAFRFRPPAAEQSRGFSLQSLFMPRMPRRERREPTIASDGSRALYVLRNGEAERVQVRTGSTDGEKTEIVSGLAAGDQVIVGLRQPGAGGGRQGSAGGRQ